MTNRFQVLKGRRMLALLASALCAAFAAWLTHHEVQQARQSALGAQDAAMVDVVVARSALAAGAVLDASTLAVRPVPRSYLPAQVVTPQQFQDIDGRILGAPMADGQPLALGLLQTRKPSLDGLAALLRPGQSAMTFMVDEVNGLSGLLHPGDRVNLLVTLGRNEGERKIFTLLSDAPVLATGRSLDPGSMAVDAGYGSITVAVPEREEDLLALARAEGRIAVVLRRTDGRDAREQGPSQSGELARWLAGRLSRARPSMPRPMVSVLYGGSLAPAVQVPTVSARAPGGQRTPAAATLASPPSAALSGEPAPPGAALASSPFEGSGRQP